VPLSLGAAVSLTGRVILKKLHHFVIFFKVTFLFLIKFRGTTVEKEIYSLGMIKIRY